MVANNLRMVLVLGLVLISWGVSGQERRFSIRGTVHHQGEVLEGAVVTIPAANQANLTNREGIFTFRGLAAGTYQLQVRYLGYTPRTLEVIIRNQDLSLDIQLEPSLTELEEVLIKSGQLSSSVELITQSRELVDRRFLDRNPGNSFVNALEKIPGVAAINTGVGIAKPVIRGMSFNRIMVNEGGIKQEGQQWGADHGLEIDQFDVHHVEVIKGPASLIYGSDAMGGVINILPEPLPDAGEIEASALGLYKSNNNLRAASAYVGGNQGGFIYKFRFSTQDFDNYRVPAEQFNYAGFTLPIFQNRLRNTAGLERNFSFTTGIKRNWGQSTVKISRFHQRVGLFPGAIGIPTVYQLQRYDQRRSIALPRQNNTHWKILWNTRISLGNDMLETDLGFQHNIRREESLPHVHGVGMTPAGTLAHGLDLRTFTANVRYHQHLSEKWSAVHGFNGQLMTNNYSGFEFLIPAFQTLQGGIFSFLKYLPAENLTFTAGARLDGGAHDIQEHRQPLYNRSLEPTGEFDQRNPDIYRRFMNVSGSVGAVWQANPQLALKLNLGSSFRMPTAIELSSNGIHHGTFRHEVGNANLQPERGYQTDLNLSYTTRKFYAELSPFFAYYDQYIYLAPTPFFSRLPSGSQLTWEFRQANSLFYGGELKTRYHLSPHIHLNAAAEWVENFNLEFGLPLPLTPPFSTLGELEYERAVRKGVLQDIHFALNTRWVADQNRVDRNERPTAGYTLFGLGAGATFALWRQPVQLMVNVDNALNRPYFNHLSRYRLLNLPEQGRNIIVSLRIPFYRTIN